MEYFRTVGFRTTAAANSRSRMGKPAVENAAGHAGAVANHSVDYTSPIRQAQTQDSAGELTKPAYLRWR